MVKDRSRVSAPSKKGDKVQSSKDQSNKPEGPSQQPVSDHNSDVIVTIIRSSDIIISCPGSRYRKGAGI